MSRLKDRWRDISLDGCVTAVVKSTNYANGDIVNSERVTGFADNAFHRWGPNASRMSDDFDAWNPEIDYKRVRPCDHMKMATGQPPDTTSIFEWGSQIGTLEYKFDGTPMSALVSEADKELFCPPPREDVVSPFAFQALNEMAEQFPPEVDIVNFLIDLKEIPGLIASVASRRNDFAEFSLKKLRNGDSFKHVAKRHIEDSFAIRPLLGDTLKLIEILQTVERRLEWLRRNKNKWVRVGSRSSYSNDDVIGLGSFHSGYYDLAATLGVYRVRTAGDLYCTGYVKQNLPWLDTWHGWVRGVLGAGSMNRPLGVIWERIPFSFVVDYFIPVGDHLNGVVFQDMLNWDVRDVSWSFKSKYDHQIRLHDAGHANDGPNDGRLVHTGTLQRYYRSSGFPPRSWYLSTPTWKQVSLLAALSSQH